MKLTSNIEHRTSNIQRPVCPPHSMLDIGCSMFEVSPSATCSATRRAVAGFDGRDARATIFKTLSFYQ
jgi:hypothetical protein